MSENQEAGHSGVDCAPGLNRQVVEAVEVVNAQVLGSSAAVAQAMTDQVMAQAIGMAMQNAVAQQQHLYTLRNAITTAVVRTILESNAEEAVRFAREMLAGDDVASTLERLAALMKDVQAGRKSSDGGTA
ncbi:RebB family R body protein [Dyella sp.]|uniref:RebB family R body protein n=1 Tax=Dyella sp. TaxID=1869338 RepID=UPI002ED4D70F